MASYIFPNELEINWGLFITLYPYITGLVAGAFIASSLYHVFGKTELRPVSKLSLVTALAFLIIAPLPLVSHLGQPTRAFNIMWTPNPTSAMAGFGYIYSLYMIILISEIWFIYRKDLVHYAQTKSGLVQKFYQALTLGADDTSSSALETDHKITNILAIIGIPAAAGLHGYVGFIFGAIKSNPWWSTPLMPVIFFLSAIVSGIALLIAVYSFSCYLRKKTIDFNCLMSLNKYLWSFLIFTATLEILEVVHKGYEGKEEWESIYHLLTQVIPVSYFGLQLTVGVFLPFFLLLVGRSTRFSNITRVALTILSSLLVLIGVFAMRFNVVIGGQMISKSFSGFTTLHLSLWGHEGILPTILIATLPIIILVGLLKLLPPWIEDKISQTNPQ